MKGVRASGHVVGEGDPQVQLAATPEEMIELRRRGGGHDERLLRVLKNGRTRVMVGVLTVEGGEQHARVENEQRYPRSSRTISSYQASGCSASQRADGPSYGSPLLASPRRGFGRSVRGGESPHSARPNVFGANLLKTSG